MFGRTNAGGGGVSMNYKVVGGTSQPSNPDANTIWVKSANEITSYRFSPVQPSGASEGMVWIKTGTSGSVILDIPKEATVRLYLTGCSQYISGAWVNVDAYIYQSSAWKQFGTAIIYLYNAGDKCTAVTGGWTSSGYSYASRDVVAPVFGTSTMKVQCTQHTSAGQVAIGGTANKIDLTNVDKIVINITAVTNSAAFIISTSKAIPSSPTKTTAISATGTVTVDVSSLTGSYYLAIRAISSTAEPTRGATTNKIYMQ